MGRAHTPWQSQTSVAGSARCPPARRLRTDHGAGSQAHWPCPCPHGALLQKTAHKHQSPHTGTNTRHTMQQIMTTQPRGQRMGSSGRPLRCTRPSKPTRVPHGVESHTGDTMEWVLPGVSDTQRESPGSQGRNVRSMAVTRLKSTGDGSRSRSRCNSSPATTCGSSHVFRSTTMPADQFATHGSKSGQSPTPPREEKPHT